jgi:membrane protease YdiL (CAAX protease family)
VKRPVERDEIRKIKIKTLVVSIVAVLGVEAALKIGLSTIPFDRMLLLGLARLLQTGALVGVVVTLEEGLACIGLERHTLYRGLKKGLFWSVGFGIVTLVALGLLFMAGVDVHSLLHTRLPAGLNDRVLFFLIGGIVAPVAEEVFFRGILYGFFRRWGFMIALVLSTGIFLLAHPMKSGIPVTQLVGGILFAVAYEVEGSLMVPIVIHVLGNLGIFAFSLVF